MFSGEREIGVARPPGPLYLKDLIAELVGLRLSQMGDVFRYRFKGSLADSITVPVVQLSGEAGKLFPHFGESVRPPAVLLVTTRPLLNSFGVTFLEQERGNSVNLHANLTNTNGRQRVELPPFVTKEGEQPYFNLISADDPSPWEKAGVGRTANGSVEHGLLFIEDVCCVNGFRFAPLELPGNWRKAVEDDRLTKTPDERAFDGYQQRVQDLPHYCGSVRYPDKTRAARMWVEDSGGLKLLQAFVLPDNGQVEVMVPMGQEAVREFLDRARQGRFNRGHPLSALSDEKDGIANRLDFRLWLDEGRLIATGVGRRYDLATNQMQEIGSAGVSAVVFEEIFYSLEAPDPGELFKGRDYESHIVRPVRQEGSNGRRRRRRDPIGDVSKTGLILPPAPIRRVQGWW